jgi:tRNA A-37 threonylcarbamoyl transferase component Bud32
MELGSFIAKGSQGSVYSIDSGIMVVKTFVNRNVFEMELHAVKSFQSLNIPYMISCYGWNEIKMWLFYENAPVSLDKKITEVDHSGRFVFKDVNKKYNLLMNIATFLRHLHKNGWIHGDIFSTNVQLKDDVTPQIIDFSMSRPIVDDTTIQLDLIKFKVLIVQVLLNISHEEVVVMFEDLSEYIDKFGFTLLEKADTLDKIVNQLKVICSSRMRWNNRKLRQDMLDLNGGADRYKTIVENEENEGEEDEEYDEEYEEDE